MIIAIIFGLFVFTFFIKSLTVIPARKVAIQERLGSFRRILTPGLWIVPWPISYIREYRWTYYNQNNKLQTITDTCVSMDKCQLDIPPIKCISKDKLQISIDGTLTYTVIDPRKALYDVDDALNLFYQKVVQCVNMIAAKYDADEIIAMIDDISADIQENVNAEKTPIFLSQFILQNVKMDDTLILNNTIIYKQSAEQKNKIALIEGQAFTRKIEREMELKEMQHERTKQQYELENRLIKSEAKAKEDSLKWKDFTIAERIEMEKVYATRCINADAKKIIYAPTKYWESSLKLTN